jgi:hypothetical protein
MSSPYLYSMRGWTYRADSWGKGALLPFAERMKELCHEASAAAAEARGQGAGELPLGSLPDHRSIPPTNVRSWTSEDKS